ncbi:MAG: helix-turn-helix transcriptional regulator [Phycisphaeraceae bacterium]|nr:helix-turn-helix transcriptional regulator [Phycisphaeraceae bacterium]
MSVKTRRQREAQARRESILKAARKLFWKQGFAGTTMPKIAAAAELAPGTLYLYFPSKSALYAELLVEGYGLLLERLEKVSPSSAGTPAGAIPTGKGAADRGELDVLVDAFLGFAAEQPEYFRIIFFVLQGESTAGRSAALDARQIRRLQDLENRCKSAALRLVTAAHADQPAAESAATADALWAMLAGVVFFWSDTAQFPAVARQAKKLLGRGLFG